MSELSDLITEFRQGSPRAIGRAMTRVERGGDQAGAILAALDEAGFDSVTIIGITGPPGAGKSTLVNRLIASYRALKQKVGVIAIDPSSPVSGGAILGDRIRMMQHATDQEVIVRSMATRGRLGGLCAAAGGVARVMAGAGCNPVIIETVGVGQSEMDIVGLADLTLLVLAPGLGDDIQAMKAGLLEVADILVVNKADLPGAEALALDLETEARQRQAGDVDLCLTEAASGKGIDSLVKGIARLNRLHRESGERLRRRRDSRRREVLDWSLEILRPLMLAEIARLPLEKMHDPAAAARGLVNRFINDRSRNGNE